MSRDEIFSLDDAVFVSYLTNTQLHNKGSESLLWSHDVFLGVTGDQPIQSLRRKEVLANVSKLGFYFLNAS